MKKILALFLLTLSFGAFANGSATGTLTAVWAMAEAQGSGTMAGAVIVFTSATPTGQPSCATTQHSFAVDSTTAAGKTVAATLELAMAAGRTVSIYGDGTCSVWGDRETIQTVVLN